MKLNLIRIILIIIIAFISITIFSFSNQDAGESSSISGKVARVIIEMQSKYKNITEEEKQALISEYQKPVRKLAHFSIYTLLGMSIAGLTCTYKLTNSVENNKYTITNSEEENNSITTTNAETINSTANTITNHANPTANTTTKPANPTLSRAAVTLISGLLYATSDEIHQTFIAGRSGQISDVLLDWAGIILGTIIVLGIYNLATKRNPQNQD